MTYCCITCEFDKARANNAPGRRNLRPMIPPVAATRDAAAGVKMSTAASTREAVPPGAPTVAYTPGATGPELSTRQWTPTPSVRVTRDTRTEGSNHPLGKAREAADPRSVRLLTESRQGDTETADPRLTVARGRHLNSEPGNDRLGQTSSAVTGEGCALDNLPQAGASGVSGPAVHRGRHVAARAVTDGGPRLGVAS